MSVFDTGPAGFAFAPVSQGLLFVTLSSSMTFQAAKISQESIPRFIRPLIRNFIFVHPGELIFGLGLLYYFRLFERQKGSVNYGSFLVVATGISSILEVIIAYFSPSRISYIWGPYAIIMAQFIPFIVDVPPTARFNLLGAQLTDKWFFYAAGLQFLFSQGFGSALIGSCSLIAGFMHRFNILGLKELVLPQNIVSVFKNTIGMILQTRNPQRVRHLGRGPQNPMGSNSQQNLNQNVAADQQLVQQLVQMGFDQQSAVLALQQTGNNLQNAVSWWHAS
eukprot:TRINITY_DN8259_c0_g1_i6.p1 TRINITY_DN8259_c0_g1~~TRINITY_DN8259_c0_g1_i6.p1  ORF type:complete len:297 (-),score=25.41 TRINITY_DN8259_c0_g1_i6:77-910(-)